MSTRSCTITLTTRLLAKTTPSGLRQIHYHRTLAPSCPSSRSSIRTCTHALTTRLRSPLHIQQRDATGRYELALANRAIPCLARLLLAMYVFLNIASLRLTNPNKHIGTLWRNSDNTMHTTPSRARDGTCNSAKVIFHHPTPLRLRNYSRSD